MISGAAGHDDDDVIRLLNDPQRPLTVPILDTVGASNAQDIHVALADLLEGDTGVLEQGQTHPLPNKWVEISARGADLTRQNLGAAEFV